MNRWTVRAVFSEYVTEPALGHVTMAVSISAEILDGFEVVASKQFSAHDEPIQSVNAIHDTIPMIGHYHSATIRFYDAPHFARGFSHI